MGAGMSMQPMGEGIGVQISKFRKLPLPLIICFALGVIITIAEPDLQVLAQQVPAIPNQVLIWSVALGVGAFLLLAVVRILWAVPLSKILVVMYAAVFLLALTLVICWLGARNEEDLCPDQPFFSSGAAARNFCLCASVIGREIIIFI